MKILLALFFWPLVAMAGDSVSLSFDDVSVSDLAKVTYSEIAKSSYVLPSGALGSVSINLSNVPAAVAVSAVDAVLRDAGYRVERRAGVVWVSKAVPVDDEVIVYRPRHRSARYLSEVVSGLLGARSEVRPAVVDVVGAAMVPGAVVQGGKRREGLPGSVDRKNEDWRIEPDQLTLSVPAKDKVKIEKLLSQLDVAGGEVVLKAAVFEVGKDAFKGGILQAVASVLGGRVGLQVAGGVGLSNALTVSVGGFDGVLSALDTDSRFQSITRPQVRVRNGATARFSVGQDVPVLGAVQFRDGESVQSIDYKQSGVIMSATPEIRGDVVEVDFLQELSSFVLTSTGVNNSPTLQKRSLSTKLSMIPGEVVVLAGLEGARDEGQVSRLPWLGWLIGDVRQKSDSEILVVLEVTRI